MHPVDIHDSLAYVIHRTARVLRRHFLHLAAESGIDLTQEQWFCLNKLRLRGPQNQTGLTDEIFGDHPNITRILAGLEKRRLVSRRPDPEDGRASLVSLTKRGAAIHDAFAEVVQRERDTIFAGIDPREMAIARKVLGQLEDRLVHD